VRTLYVTGVRIGIGIFVQPSVASYEDNAKRNIGFGLVVVENSYSIGIHYAYWRIYRFWVLFYMLVSYRELQRCCSVVEYIYGGYGMVIISLQHGIMIIDSPWAVDILQCIW